MDAQYLEHKSEIIQSLMDDVKSVSIPRMVGTEGEKKIQRWLKSRISSIGFTPRSQPFQASLFRINTLQSFSNLMIAILFPLAVYLFSIHPLLFLIPLVLIMVDIYLVSTGSISTAQPPNVPKFVKCMDTENIYATFPNSSSSDLSDSKLHIIFMGHYDSKSTVVTGKQRILLYVGMLLSALVILLMGLAGMVLYFFNPNWANHLVPYLWIFAFLGLITGGILTFNVVGNKSFGASDNGTAVALNLAMLQYFSEHPVEGVNFTFLFTAAEEIGLTGAYNFAKANVEASRWNPKRTFVINWDLAGLPGDVMVNTGVGVPKKLTSTTMTALLDIIAQEQALPVHSLYLPIGGWHDGLPFTEYGIENITFWGKSFDIHSEKDTPEIIDEESLFKNFVVSIELVKKLMQKFIQ